MFTRSNSRRATRQTRAIRNCQTYSLYRRTLRFEPLEVRRLLAVVTVTTLADTIDFSDGRLSLREAIFATNTVLGADTINFASSLTASGSATIVLKLGELKITDGLAIDGPGASLLTIDASGNDSTPTLKDGKGTRIFNFDDGTANSIDCSLSGLRLTRGDVTGSGGAILNVEKLALNQMTLDGNFSTSSGGGVYSSQSGIASSIAISSSLFAGNTSKDFGGGGVTVRTSGGASISILGSVFHGNSSSGDGGSLNISTSDDGQILIDNNEFSGNSTNESGGRGGGLYLTRNGAGDLLISHNQFSSNSTKGTTAQGGGAYVAHSGSGALEITNNSFSGNSTNGTVASGGGLYVTRGGAGDLLLSDNQFSSNSTKGTGAEGGGAYATHSGSGQLEITKNLFSGNSTSGNGTQGGGAYAPQRYR